PRGDDDVGAGRARATGRLEADTGAAPDDDHRLPGEIQLAAHEIGDSVWGRRGLSHQWAPWSLVLVSDLRSPTAPAYKLVASREVRPCRSSGVTRSARFSRGFWSTQPRAAAASSSFGARRAQARAHSSTTSPGAQPAGVSPRRSASSRRWSSPTAG